MSKKKKKQKQRGITHAERAIVFNGCCSIAAVLILGTLLVGYLFAGSEIPNEVLFAGMVAAALFRVVAVCD